MFWAPTRRRHYATLHQACCAEAGAILTREWRQDGDDEGRWVEDPDWMVRRGLLIAQIKAAFLSAAKESDA